MAFLRSQSQRAALLVILLGIALAIAVFPFATGLLGIVVLHVIFAPVHRLLSRWLPRSAAAVLVCLAALVLVLLPGAILVNTAVREAPGTLRALREGRVMDRLAALEVAGMPVGAQLSAAGGTAFAWISEQAFTVVGSVTRGTLSLGIALFGLYYLLMASGAAWRAVRPYVPFSDDAAERMRRRFHLVTEATLLGTFFTALVQGSMVGLGFWAVGLPNAAFWGTMTALVSVLPIMGSAIIWLPGVVVLALDGRWGAAGVLLAVGMTAAGADNVVRMIVYKKVSDIHPLATLVGAFAGLQWFGLLGVLVGPLAIAYFFELLKMYREEYGADRQVEAPPPEPLLPAGTTAVDA
ncbi:MAG TPA: AI-2E family transporter [Longimicrobiaceae bacterium]|nr:AI-2E family transporter [Longimicrobiaceae bacterium]